MFRSHAQLLSGEKVSKFPYLLLTRQSRHHCLLLWIYSLMASTTDTPSKAIDLALIDNCIVKHLSSRVVVKKLVTYGG